MFNKVLVANRGDQPHLCGAAAKLNCMQPAGQAGDFAAEVRHV